MSDDVERVDSPQGSPHPRDSEAPGPDVAVDSAPAAKEEDATLPVGEPVATESEARRGDRGAATDAAKKARKRRRKPDLALFFRKGIPVEGKVEKVIRGGYEVRVGNARGFCPHSQMDLHHVDNPEEHVGTVHAFRVIQLRRGGEEVILSRRALLEEERSEEAKAVRATLIEGSVRQGRVGRLTEFGAFVDLGAGVTGLVHVSEVSHSRVERPSDALKPGDIVQVRVLKLDDSTGRISLSLRQAAGDPWESVPTLYQPGRIYPGILRRLADFGAFVEMAPGVEALAPTDGFPPGAGGWREGLGTGQTMAWRVVSVDRERRRMSVLPATEGDAAVEPRPLPAGAQLKGRVQRVERFGVFVWLRPGEVGLLPSSHTGTRKGTDLTKAFPVGKEIEVEVLEAGPAGGRIRLSVPGALAGSAPAAPPRSAPRKDRERASAKPRVPEAQPASSSQAFGTSLGDVLRKAFKKNSTG